MIFIDNCPDEYTKFQRSCYKVNSANPVTRSNAADICSADDAHLVDITSAEEQDFVAQLVSNDPTMNAKTPGSDFSGAWIGLMNIFQWSDGAPLVYTAWAHGGRFYGTDEPNVNCVRMDSHNEYQWGDRDCETMFNFVCEKEPGKIFYNSILILISLHIQIS